MRGTSCVSLFQKEQSFPCEEDLGAPPFASMQEGAWDESTSASALDQGTAPYHRVSPAVGGCQAKLQVSEEPRPGRHQIQGRLAGRRRRSGWDQISTMRRQGGLGVKEPQRSGRMGP